MSYSFILVPLERLTIVDIIVRSTGLILLYISSSGKAGNWKRGCVRDRVVSLTLINIIL